MVDYSTRREDIVGYQIIPVKNGIVHSSFYRPISFVSPQRVRETKEMGVKIKIEKVASEESYRYALREPYSEFKIFPAHSLSAAPSSPNGTSSPWSSLP